MRIVTRSDFDGLVCAALLSEVLEINEIVFSHPKDIQDGKVRITSDDILADLPYNPNCHLWFDHHSSEEKEEAKLEEGKGSFSVAPSTSRVIYEYYKKEGKYENYEEILKSVDKVDSAQLEEEDVKNPSGWILLSYIMDSRTSLGLYRHFRISNYQLMIKMLEWIPEYTAEEILEFPDIEERVELYFEMQEAFGDILVNHSYIDENIVITDLRDVEDVPTGNRFYIYTLFPEVNVSIRIFHGAKQNIVVAVGHSIFNRTCQTNIGALMKQFGGGGHKGVGTCQLSLELAEKEIKDIIKTLKKNG